MTGNLTVWITEHRLNGLLLRGPGVAAPAEVVSRLTAMQAQEHPHARWSVAQRMAGQPRSSAIDQAFDEGRFLRTHVLRPTWHYVAASDLRWLIRLSGPRVDAGNAPMRGKQHTYAPFDQRVPAAPGPEGDEALAELAWRYFSTRGPATLRDFSWWSGISAGDTRHAHEMVRPRLVSREDGGRGYWFAEQSLAPSPMSRIDLVQCYDELIISYSQTRDVLNGPLAAFKVPGDIDGFRHVLLMGGRLLGHWRVRDARGLPEVETRAAVPLNGEQQSELTRAVEGYRRFTEP